ncbi:MAG TPA: mandelate racemase/muconate lactonizing enzyme family protein [Stellaceae bacterium]|nr:mandelate racemase/muconate lactonizing enzyme family protein [Stellaceae bacterium]
MTRITKLRARAVAVPLEAATAFSRRSVSERHYALVEVEGDDGHKGIGFCYAGHAGGTLVTKAINGLLAKKVIGQDAHRVEGLWEEMYQEALLAGRLGAVLRAISAIDNALWDRNARAAGLPLYKYLGACRDDAVPAYASGGYYLAGKTPEMLGEEVAGYVRQGFKAVKIKVGRGDDLGLERARIAASRAAIGPDVLLMLDANNAWSDLPTALRFMRVFEPFDPYWIEEPFGPDDIDNHARLARATPVPVATGEIEGGRWRFKELLDKEAAMILQTDACVCGGISEFRRIAATAASYGVTLCPHWFHDIHTHLVAATPNARFVELFTDDKVLNFRRLVAPQQAVQDGMIRLPDRPGIGCDFIPEMVERYATEPWS